MLINLKALVVVLGLATVTFAIAKSTCLRFMGEKDFRRRRNVWLALTAIAFASPSFWIYAVAALLILTWAESKESSSVALYVIVMQVIPASIAVDPPTVGVNRLFEVTNYRILSLAILIPAMLRIMQRRGNRGRLEITGADLLLLGYLALQLVLLTPYESGTNTLRRAFLLVIDVALPYLVVSRSCKSARSIAEVMACFCLVSVVYVALAIFESTKGWLLYQGLGILWHSPDPFAYLMRGEVLRAQVSAGHSISLGYMFALAFGFMLYLRTRIASRMTAITAPLAMWLGMLAAYSRSPWIIAIVIFFAFMALGPNGLSRLLKSLTVSAVLAGMVLTSPLGDQVLDNVPFIGSIGESTVQYRAEVARQSWHQIQQHPLFGNPLVVQNLEDLRQGQGIVDLMNTYTNIAMFYGFVGLAAFVSFFLLGMLNAYRSLASFRRSDSDLSMLGACLLASTVGTLAMMATSALAGTLGQLCWLLAGLNVSYGWLYQTQGTNRGKTWPSRRQHARTM